MTSTAEHLPAGLQPPARTDVHTEQECDTVLSLLSARMRRTTDGSPRYLALVESADAWLDERNRCRSALALHDALDGVG